MNGFTGKRNPGIPRWAQQREFFLVGVAAFGAFVGRLGDVWGVRGTFGAFGRDVACNVSTTASPTPAQPIKPPAQPGNNNHQP